ncbi:FKBP-type peptidyl-prolyl cis-trans isomerase [Paludibacter sp. 221]|uniref:FKBP-type peptidyl-prolyl cis-trans isomerase n=1 Tax=Paludibacter sp. 221 TaxID=2302939 RepID=UPI0013D5EF0B|nr:FKBP-type peptidyl-prolyl cis-trans isomerase [Paludibacter sp. 221]NDV46819.1 FKBP-type peptidyl-prolyl cis-trans isomerase [Paludibacter sp. 221]
MKKILLLSAVCLLALSPAEAQKKKNKKAGKEEAPVFIMSNAVDSMSYALGISVGNDLLTNFENIPGGEYNTNVFLKGFETALKKDSALMTNEFAQEFFQSYMMKAYEKETEAKIAAGEKFLAENKEKEGVIETASGLQYIVEREGNGAIPAENDVVKVSYEGFLLDGTKFDSSIERNEPLEFPVNQVIQGWSEGLQLMKVGSKYKFFIPYHLAYGERGAGNVIPPYSTLIFDVELLEIVPQ